MRRYRYHYGKPPKEKKKTLIIIFSIICVLVIFFVPGPNGLARVIYKTIKKHQLHNEIEQLKTKAELIESKISKGQDEKYLRKLLIDNYKMVPKDSVK